MKWYVVHLLFAQLPEVENQTVKCESCCVLFEALSAVAAYDKGLVWASSYMEGTLFHFVGIEHIHRLGDEKPGDGTEIDGSFFDDEDVWERKDELIPERNKIPAIIWEQNCDVPIGELMTEKQKENLKEIFGEE
jgi:hypothetical protein